LQVHSQLHRNKWIKTIERQNAKIIAAHHDKVIRAEKLQLNKQKGLDGITN
jgi:hypothetical protein